jgi:hypothetical protein
MKVDWNVMSQKQAEWMGHWSKHIQGNGSK